MQSSVGTYRPNLCNAAVAQAKPEPTEAVRVTGSVAFRNIYPNPFTAQTNVQLVMPRSGQVTVNTDFADEVIRIHAHALNANVKLIITDCSKKVRE